MSRQSTAQSRNLSLTEELEKLEQSITLTLQEIDHNFSRAHRIVTGSIIPIVEQYAKHSDAVWEGSKFWKQFFEASANVSLSSYEEAAEEDLTALEESQSRGDGATPSSQAAGDDTVTASDAGQSSHFDDDLEDSLLDSPSVTVQPREAPGKAPQAAKGKAVGTTDAQAEEETSFAEYNSPYETLKEEMRDGKRPATPRNRAGPTARTPSNQPSTTAPESVAQSQRSRPPNNDPLLHRVLDKNYRVAATPHTTRKKPSSSHGPSATATAQKPVATAASNARSNPALDSSPFSPDIAAPQLRSEIFGSPVARGPRTPGISVQKASGKTPLKEGFGSARKTLFPKPSEGDANGTPAAAMGDDTRRTSEFDDRLWDSDDYTNDDNFAMSPPKTIQFHVPQSRLMQTPAREASKKIVEDLLLTAGAASVTSTMEDLQLDEDARRWEIVDEDSPSIVRVAPRNEDEEDF